MRHHNNVIMEYLTSNDISGAREYLSQYSKNLEFITLESFCQNSAANAVLRVYMRKAKSLNIDYAVIADISENLPINSSDFSSLLSNLLENACEAAEKVTAGKRFLSLRAETEETTLNIEIINSSLAVKIDSDGFPQTTKSGGGVGLLSVKRILDSCGGIMKINHNSHEFITQIIIPSNSPLT